MYAHIGFVMCLFVGSSVAYYPQREAPYYSGPNDPYSVGFNQNPVQEPSQRLFWGNQGSNQVGGTGLWATLTNKFPILGSMFGRMELPAQYGVPNQYDVSTQYGAPGGFQPQYYQGQQQFYQQVPQQGAQQFPRQFGQRFVPSGRDVGITDDAVIVTPPFVPPVQPAPFPSPVPAPVPAPAPAPVPAPGPSQEEGYTYNRPQYRLELPQR
ncbi:prion-like-(Q/N-rich) domain-bearing protein 96 [Helicoverpa armigera]|uniref:prion-like-(Q/N-rich) domain-bearing protein 96 n=1 Tax=Helicoverpa armigera TaxID=29058 RepID=UPI0030828319